MPPRVRSFAIARRARAGAAGLPGGGRAGDPRAVRSLRPRSRGLHRTAGHAAGLPTLDAARGPGDGLRPPRPAGHAWCTRSRTARGAAGCSGSTASGWWTTRGSTRTGHAAALVRRGGPAAGRRLAGSRRFLEVVFTFGTYRVGVHAGSFEQARAEAKRLRPTVMPRALAGRLRLKLERAREALAARSGHGGGSRRQPRPKARGRHRREARPARPRRADLCHDA